MPPSNDVTPYYSVESVDSPLRTNRADPTVYLSALSATPQPSPVQYTIRRSQASASTSTDPLTQPIVAEFGAQTSSIKQFTQAGADFAMQTSPSLNDGGTPNEAKIDEDKSETASVKTIKRSTGGDVESNITATTVDRTETHSSASQFHVYDKEQDSAVEVRRVKKLTKQKPKISSPPSIESSFVTFRRIPANAKYQSSANEEASLESQAFRQYMRSTIGSYKNISDDPNANRNERGSSDSDPPLPKQNDQNDQNDQDDQNEMAMQELDEVNQPKHISGSVKRTGSSSSTLSSEPYLEAGFHTNLELGDGFVSTGQH